jgi:hypothetical protein
MADVRSWCCAPAVALSVLLSPAPPLGAQRETDEKKPSLSLRATPPVGFTPLRVRLVVDVKGGSDDYAEFYCAGVEWDWGDGTVSESSSDCDPYEPGKSTIRRRFTAEHVFRQRGAYKVVFKLKQKTRQVGVATSSVEVRAGLQGFR